MPKHTQAMHNDNGDDNDNVDDNVNVDVNVDADGDADVNENVAAAAASKNTDGEPSVSAAAPAAEKEWKKDMTEQEMENFVAWFNHYMKESKIPCVRNITQKRRRLMREIWDNHNLSDLKRAFYQASQSSFLNNRTKRHFLANFDWIMQPENFDRILEGNFND